VPSDGTRGGSTGGSAALSSRLHSLASRMRSNGGTIALAMLLATASLAQTGSIEIVDRDTVKVGGVSWRFPGYDTPETYYAQCDAERQAGVLATKGLEALSAGAAR
jgi:hypothetical protein